MPNDGRGIDTSIAILEGEASRQRSHENGFPAWRPAAPVEDQAVTYYGQPLLKPPVWGIDIPLYYFVGGAAGAALALGAMIQIACRDPQCTREFRKLSSTCHWIGIAGSTVGAFFLIHDLGRPARFLHMMRVFRPSSPMNMGAWILAGAAPSAITAGLLVNRGGRLGSIGDMAGYVSGFFGANLAGYTGVLVSTTAIPIWQQARRWMPVLFMASAISSAAGIIDLFAEGRRGARIVQIYGSIGRAAELAAARMVENTVAQTPRVADPLRSGRSGLLWKASGALTAASLVLALIPGHSRKVRAVAGTLSIAGSLCLRFAVHYGSDASARDARASFDHQRAAV